MSNAAVTQTRRQFILLVSAGTVGVALRPGLAEASAGAANAIVLSSPKFKAGENMPVAQTQYGLDVSPALAWDNLPAGTKELALIFEGALADPPRPIVYWLVYGIPADLKGLSEGLPMEAKVNGQPFVQGITAWPYPGYHGPYPRDNNKNEFRFRLYAIDKQLNLKPGLNSKALLKAIEGHILDTGELVVIAQQSGARAGRGQATPQP